MFSTEQKDFGKLKPLLYRKLKKLDVKEKNFKKDGIIHEESFQFDELKRKREEYFDYCLKKIHAAIFDKELADKDAKKSPLNVQIANSQRRKSTRN